MTTHLYILKQFDLNFHLYTNERQVLIDTHVL